MKRNRLLLALARTCHLAALRVAATLFLALAPATSARADNFSDNFPAAMDQTAIDALAEDLGTLMGGSSFHEGKALGFPLGFDLGIHVPVAGVSDNDTVLRDNGSTARAHWLQAEYGLPGRINIIGRVGEMEDADLIGGGLRWGAFVSSVPGVPSVSVSALYGKFKHDLFDGETISGNVVASFEVPFIHPYIGAGYDKTSLDPDGSALDGDAEGYRVEAGINISIIPFTYVTLGGGLANGEKLGHLGLGVRI
jgi:hypothetical protein